MINVTKKPRSIDIDMSFLLTSIKQRNLPSSGARPRFLLIITILSLFFFFQSYYKIERNINRPDLTEIPHISNIKIKNKSRKTIVYKLLYFHFLICLRSCSNNWEVKDFDKILFSRIPQCWKRHKTHSQYLYTFPFLSLFVFDPL